MSQLAKTLQRKMFYFIDAIPHKYRITLKFNGNKMSLPGQFAESENLFTWQVSDGDFSIKWYQMMFAHGKHFNVFNHDHFIVVLIENGSVEDLWKLEEKKWFYVSHIVVEDQLQMNQLFIHRFIRRRRRWISEEIN